MSPGAPTLVINGSTMAIEPGETILQVAQRNGMHIPTLCHDPRLDPTGACRMCLVEIDGWRRPQPSCAVRAQPGMAITTESTTIDRHRSTLLALYMADHPADADECENGAPCEVHDLADKYEARRDLPRLVHTRGEYAQPNPYIWFRADRCIACAKCVRYCEEVEAVSAITFAGRGSRTTISTADNVSLLDSTCELCGGCIDVCPTGAMAEKIPLVAQAPPERELTKVRTTCNYCGVGCQMDLNVDPGANDGRGRVVKVTSPPPGTLPNDGNLCVKGRFAYQFIEHPDRLTHPLIRGEDGQLHRASWDEALATAAAGLLAVKNQHGHDAMGFVSSSRCTGEENYLVQKLARAAFGTNNCHQCAAT